MCVKQSDRGMCRCSGGRKLEKSGVTNLGTEFKTFFFFFFMFSVDGAELREGRIIVKTSLLSRISDKEVKGE